MGVHTITETKCPKCGANPKQQGSNYYMCGTFVGDFTKTTIQTPDCRIRELEQQLTAYLAQQLNTPEREKERQDFCQLLKNEIAEAEEGSFKLKSIVLDIPVARRLLRYLEAE